VEFALHVVAEWYSALLLRQIYISRPGRSVVRVEARE
jgi:hypothetical protein